MQQDYLQGSRRRGINGNMLKPLRHWRGELYQYDRITELKLMGERSWRRGSWRGIILAILHGLVTLERLLLSPAL
jgi:hypothetical protein